MVNKWGEAKYSCYYILVKMLTLQELFNEVTIQK